MKIAKLRLIKIIREEIIEARLRNNIRSVMREFTSTSTATSAEKKGFKSKTRKCFKM